MNPVNPAGANASPTDSLPAFDKEVVWKHIQIVHRLASESGRSGKIIVCSYGEDPTTGEKTKIVFHAAIADAQTSYFAAMSLEADPHSNVYVPLSILRSDIPDGRRGTADEIEAVLGAVLDADNDKGEFVTPPLEADYIIQSSSQNRQYFYFFDRALTPEEAKPLLAALVAAGGGDTTAKDIAKVFRVAGCRNAPSATKIKRGRPSTPQLVTVVKPWSGSRTSVDKLREILAPHWTSESSKAKPKSGTARKVGSGKAPTITRELNRYDLKQCLQLFRDCRAYSDRDPKDEMWQAAYLKDHPNATRDDLRPQSLDGYKTWEMFAFAAGYEHGAAGRALIDAASYDPQEMDGGKCETFCNDPKGNAVTLDSVTNWAWKRGIGRIVGQSLEKMFGHIGTIGPAIVKAITTVTTDTVNEIATNAGATLSNAPDGQSLFGRDEKRAEVGGPILSDFLLATRHAPDKPTYYDFVTMPHECANQKLYGALNEAIPRLLAVCEWGSGKGSGFDKDMVRDVFAVIFLNSEATGKMILRRARQAGLKLNDRQVLMATEALRIKVEAALHQEKTGFTRDKNLKIKKSYDNVCRLYEILSIEARFNAWLERIEVRGWEFGSDWTSWGDPAEIDIRMHASTEAIEFNFPIEFHWSAANRLARQNTIDPSLDWIASCEAAWDGVPRLNGWLSKACGVPADDPYYAMVGKNLLGNIVRRVRTPGCKCDEMTVFVSTKQGTGKSTMGRALVPDEKWFAERIKLGAEPKELVLLLAGKMICEVSEMGTKGQVNDVKSMLSAQSDEGRPAYARSVQDRPRRNIFIGSTNHTRFLVDETGNRRFLPVILKQAIDIEWIEANRDQLIGEAAVMHSAGEKFRVPPEMYDICAQHQERARLQSPEELIIEEELAPNSLCPLMFIRGAALEKLCIAAGFKGHKDREPMMTRLGFKHHDNSKRIHGTQSKVWIRDTRDQPNEDMRTAVEFIVDTSTADKFPKVTLRDPAGPSSVGKPGAPAMPPQTAETEEPWVRPGNNNLFDNRPPPPPEPTKH